MIEIDKIRTDGGTQARAQINAETVAEYAEAMRESDTVFPPVIVYHDGKNYWLADGFHRVAAWAEIGRKEIPAEVRQGDQRRAILHSVAANAAHGLRRTNADKRRAVETLLRDDEWAAWSNREIARRCRVSDMLVGDVRKSLTANSCSEDEARTYTTKHGTEAQMDTARIGKVGSSRDDEPSPVHKTSGNPGADKSGISDADASDGPEHRKGLSGLTREGLEDEVAGLRAENVELRDKLKAARAERDRYKEANKLLSEGNQGATISRLMKQRDAAAYARDEAQTQAKREQYKRKQAEKRAAEIEAVEIPYG